MKCRIFLVLLLAIALPSAMRASDQSSVESIVDRYLAAIQSRDWATMASFLTEGSSYRDFTAAALGDPIDLVGTNAIVDFWRESAETSGTRGLRYEIVKRFTSGPATVLDVVAHIRARADAWNIGGGGEIEIEAPLVIFVHIDAGKVAHHHDHVDYTTLMANVAQLRAERGAVEPIEGQPGHAK